MKTITTESAAWRYLLKKIITQNGLTPGVSFLKGTGLCREVTEISYTLVPHEIKAEMLLRIESHLAMLNAGVATMDHEAYFAPQGDVTQRVIALQWFILEAREEERAAEINDPNAKPW